MPGRISDEMRKIAIAAKLQQAQQAIMQAGLILREKIKEVQNER